MNKTQLKQFASTARKKLEEAVRQKAYSFGITKDYVKPLQEIEDGLIINGTVMGERERKQYTHLKNRIAMDGYETVMSEAAYTWFNRFVALRYMEVNNFLPIATRILSSEKDGKKEPDALTDVLMLTDELDLNKERVYQLKEDNQLNNLYQYLLIKQSNKLGDILPNVFERITDDMALLLPDNLLNENSVVLDIVELVDEESWKEVEIVGWLYQFYISEEKDEVFANLKKKKKIGKQEIGPATQLFTPRWIVEYMVDNSLGRLWLESHPDESIQSSLNYYLEDAEQPESVIDRLESLKDPTIDIEEISFLDPSCGSGHILVYAFEVFYKIYLSRGYREREIPKLILQNNLYGLDIDKRASQLATFALVMKAREFDKRLFSREYTVHVHSIEESNAIDEEQLHLFFKDDETLFKETTKLINTFEDGKMYGSITQITKIDIDKIENQITFIRENVDLDLMTLDFIEYSLPIIEDLVDQYNLLAKNYDVVVTNPPYMGNSGMNKKLSDYVKKKYPDSKSDLFAVFIEKCASLLKPNGYQAMITQHAWMFLSRYEKLRNQLMHRNIVNMVHLGTRAFSEISGEVVQTTAFVLSGYNTEGYCGTYTRLVDFPSQSKKQDAFLSGKCRYKSTTEAFQNVPGRPLAYWADINLLKAFERGIPLGEKITTRVGIMTGDNKRFLRLWWQVSKDKTSMMCKSVTDKELYKNKWFPYDKGGGYRKWYGNNEYLINFQNNGYEIFEQAKKDSRNSQNYPDSYKFRKSLTWSVMSSGPISVRYSKEGSLFDIKGSSCFTEDDDLLLYCLSFLNSTISRSLLSLISPTLDYNAGYVGKLPLIFHDNILSIKTITNQCIDLARADWDSFETSWDYKEHPFITYKDSLLVEDSYNKWNEITEDRFYQLKSNEEELNRIFIDIYGLQEELTPDVKDIDITVRKAKLDRDVKSFLSYLVGVMFGRYSLDQKGLAYAGGEWDDSLYTTYQPDETNIIPLTEDQYFHDDIMNKVEELLIKIYGEETLEENLMFIAEVLTKKASESPRDRIRRYFMKEFYKDHLKIYQKRPIYWQFTSGKRGAFKGLMYLHRYNKNTIAQLRTDYVLHEAKVIDNLIQHETNVIKDESSTQAQKARAQKLIDEYTKDRQELAQYDQVIEHVAKQEIDLDLDDGVKINYQKFQDIEIMDDHSSKSKKLNVFEKI